MAQSAAHLVEHVIARVLVRQWVLSPPIPLRLLLAAQPVLLTPVLQVVHRVITRHLLDRAGFKADAADSGAVKQIQRLGLRPISTDTCIAKCWTTFTGAPIVGRYSSRPIHSPMRHYRRCCTRSSPG